MSKASVNPNCVSVLAKEIASQWLGDQGNQGLSYKLGDTLNFLALLLCQPAGPGGDPSPAWVLPYWQSLNPEFEERLQQGANHFVSFHKKRLFEQGLERSSEAGLRAFFFSALYEALRFDTTVEGARANEQAGRRKRPKRCGAAYFTPPALAYLAAYRALSAYFGKTQCPGDDQRFELPLPLICDPAMGTGLYLVAALDYLSIERPALSRKFLAAKCLFGVDIDAITCGAAKHCLALAAGSAKEQYTDLDDNLLWSDAILADLPLADLPEADIVLTNPPWDIVKAAKTSAGGRVPSRVNKARSATLRQAFSHQGEGDTSYYKLFLERSYQILKPGGVASVLTPAALCGDKGASPLRALILGSCDWLSLDGFINEDNAFAIHPHFKYVLLCFKKGFSTQSIKTRFGLVASKSLLVDASGEAGSSFCGHQFLYNLPLIKLLGGPTGAILELASKGDVDLLTAIYQNHSHLRLKDFLDSRGDFFRREFDMTLDRSRFITAKRAGQLQFRGDFACGAEVHETYLPLFEGRMIGQFEPGKAAAPARYFVKASDYRRRVPRLCAKLGFVSITSAFNTRSMIASYLPDLPAGNSVPTLVFESCQNDFLPAVEEALYTTALFNSFVFDWMVRLRLAGNNLSYHLLEGIPFPPPGGLPAPLRELTVALSALLSLNKRDFSAEILALSSAPLYRQAILGAELSYPNIVRLRLWLEVLVCEIYGLSPAQVAYILRDCQVSAEALRLRRHLNGEIRVGQFVGPCRDPGREVEPDQRGFFRVDKTLAPHLRLTNLVNLTFATLKSSGADFVATLFQDLGSADLTLSLPEAVEQSLSERFATCATDTDDCLRFV
jgi:hypothetical protein